MKDLLKWFLILFLFFNGSATYAQQLWSGVTVKADITKKIYADLEQQVRFEAGEFNYLNSFTEAGAGFRFTTGLTTKVSYRLIRDPNFYFSRHRVSADLLLKKKFEESDIKLSSRSRFQRGFNRNLDLAKNYLRLYLELEYKLASLAKPFIGFEAFYRMDDKKEFRFLRYNFGLNIKVTEALSFQLFYRYEKEINVKYPVNTNIIGVMFSWQLNKLKEEKDELLDN